MNTTELLLTAKKVANSYINSDIDLNDSISKIACDQSLSKNMIERLIEESNKATFLTLLEKNGEQQFPVADYNVIKTKLLPVVEKKASEIPKFESITYSDSEFKKHLGENKSNDTIIKIAETTLTEEQNSYLEALIKVANNFMDNYNKFTELQSIAYRRYGSVKDLEKTAELNNDLEVLSMSDIEKEIYKQASIYEIILNKIEKNAGLVWGELNPYKAFTNTSGSIVKKTLSSIGAGLNLGTKAVIGTPISLAGGAAKLGLKGAAVAAPVAIPLLGKTVIKHPGATLTLASEGGKAVSSARGIAKAKNFIGPGTFLESTAMEKNAGIELFKTPLIKAVNVGMNAIGIANKAAKPVTDLIGPGKIALGSIEKDANIMSGLQHALDFIIPATSGAVSGGPAGILAGLTAAAAKKIGGGIALTMNKKEFDKSFDVIMKNNPNFANEKQKIRSYFDIMAQNAPSLAKDPIVAESIVKNMNAFGGVDFNTIRGFRETEQIGKEKPSDSFGVSGLSSFNFLHR